MFIGSSMLYKNDVTTKLYHELAELEEKLSKSEAERRSLEVQFEYLAENYKHQEKKRTNQLNEKYNEFVKYCKERNERNERILRSLDRIETGANAVFAKTERLKQLRSYYNAYLTRMSPIWQQQPSVQVQQKGRRSIAISANNAPLESSHALPGAGGGVIDDLHAYGGGRAVIAGITGLRRIGYGHIYVIPEKDLDALEDSRYLAPVVHTPPHLGEAGERMLEELNKGGANVREYLGQESIRHNNTESLGSFNLESNRPKHTYALREEPQQFPRYGLWPHIQNTPCGTDALNYAKSLGINSSKPMSFSSNSRRSPTPILYDRDSLVEKQDPEAEAKVKSQVPVNLKLSSPKGEFIHREKSRDNFEIECLSADGNYIDEDHNLSDDEVLDGAMNRSTMLEMDGEEPRMASGNFMSHIRDQYHPSHDTVLEKQIHSIRNNGGQQFQPYQNERVEDEQRFKNDSAPGIAGRVVLENVAKRSLVTHKKSVEELKAMLSLEEDGVMELPLADPQRIQDDLEDEDVPEEFTEQPWPNDHYDPRYERDVSRNVILEEEEPDDIYEGRHDEGRHVRRDWRKVQHFKEQGKLVPPTVDRDFNQSQKDEYAESGDRVFNPRHRGDYAESPMQASQDFNRESPVSNEQISPGSQQRPRMLANAVNLFKERRRSIGAERHTMPNVKIPDVAAYPDGPQADERQAPPIQRNVGNYLRGLVEKERRRSPEVDTRSTPPPRQSEAAYPNHQSEEVQMVPIQRNVGNYLRSLAEKEQARRSEQKNYEEMQRHEPEYQPNYVPEKRIGDESHQFVSEEPLHGYERSELNNEKCEAVGMYDQRWDDMEHLKRLEAEESGGNAIYNQDYAEETQEPLHFDQMQHADHVQNGNEQYEHSEREGFDGNDLQLGGVYSEEQQIYSEYNPPVEHDRYHAQGLQENSGRLAEETPLDPSYQDKGYMDEERSRDDRQWPVEDYEDAGYLPPNDGDVQPQFQEEYPVSQTLDGNYSAGGSHQEEAYAVHDGNYQESDEHFAYQEEFGHDDQRQDDYRERESEEHQYQGQYQAQDSQYSQGNQEDPQQLAYEATYENSQYQDYEVPGDAQPDQNYGTDQQYESSYGEEKGQAEYQGQHKEQFQPQMPEESHPAQEAVAADEGPTGLDGVVKPSVMAQLIDSESESYQVSAEQAPDDSDFDFSMGK